MDTGAEGSELLKVTPGLLTCTAGWMVVAFTEEEHEENVSSAREELKCKFRHARFKVP